MTTPPNPLRPSPLSFNSPSRASPFRRPNSPLAHSPSTIRAREQQQNASSPLKPSTPSGLSPEKTQSPLRNTTNFIGDAEAGASSNPPWMTTRGSANTPELPTSPTRIASNSTVRPLGTSAPRYGTPTRDAPAPLTRSVGLGGDTISKVPPPLLHSLRESFSVLDRSNSGTVTNADVSETLRQLGLDDSAAAYLPPGSSSINLSTYLNTLSSLIAPLSQPSELLAAFEAFDDEDSGQIDLEDLKDALLHIAPEPGEKRLSEREFHSVVDGFSGRRAFGKSNMMNKPTKKGDVFRYNDFVSGITGGPDGKTGPQTSL